MSGDSWVMDSVRWFQRCVTLGPYAPQVLRVKMRFEIIWLLSCISGESSSENVSGCVWDPSHRGKAFFASSDQSVLTETKNAFPRWLSVISRIEWERE